MSVQQQLYHQVYAMADAAQSPEQIKAVQQHLSQSLQDNAIPGYVGVPLMQGLTQRLQQASAMPQGSQAPKPPVAQQVMQAAQQADKSQTPQAPQGITQGMPLAQGINQLPSNLPAEGMAGGGIIAFGGDGPEKSVVPKPNNSTDGFVLSDANIADPNFDYTQTAAYKDFIRRGNPNTANPMVPYNQFMTAVNQSAPAADDATLLNKSLSDKNITPINYNAIPSNTNVVDATTSPTPLSGLDTLAAQLAASKGGFKPVEYKPMTDEGSDYNALLEAPKTIEQYAAEKKARIGENPALAERATRLATMEAENTKTDEQSPWMALMKAGLATMGGTSQYALTNIGKGGEAGLEDYIKSQDKITAKKEKLYDAQTALSDAKRNEQLALEKYGEDSKQAEETKNFTINTAKIANKHAVDLANHTGYFDASKTNAQILSQRDTANQSAQVQLAINKADIDSRNYIAGLTNTRDISNQTRALYDKAHDNAVNDLKLEIGDKPDYMTGPYKSGAEVQQALMRSIVKNQRAMNLPIMLPPGYSEQPSGAGKIEAVDKKLGYDLNYIQNKG